LNRRGEVILALLAAVTAVTWWLARSDSNDDAPLTVTHMAQPGYYLREATFEETDDAGRLYLRVTTPKADQNPQSQEIALGPVRVDYFPADTAPWVLTGDRGVLPAGARSVTLSDNVTMRGSPIAHRAAAVLHTSTATLDTVTSVATTVAPVRIEFGSQVVTATGMRADLKRDRVALESNVRGTYVR